MKKRLLIFPLLLLPAVAIRAQQPAPTPPAPTQQGPPAGQEATAPFPFANRIVIHTSDGVATAYRTLCQVLLAQGYKLEKMEEAQGRIRTDYHRSPYRGVKASLQFTLVAQPTGTTIEEQAIGQVISADSRFPVECRGTPKMPIACAWAEMWRVASLYPAGSLAFKRQ